MRIIAGQFKGQKLCSFSADFIRPMTDRVKTAVFNTLFSLDHSPAEKQVLDLFSGTGNLFLESLSRGARAVWAVDCNKKAIRIIQKNYALLNQKATKKPKIQICKQDVFRFLASYKGPSFDLIFADPPFKKHWAKKIVESCLYSKITGENSLLVLEISIQENAPALKPHINANNKAIPHANFVPESTTAFKPPIDKHNKTLNNKESAKLHATKSYKAHVNVDSNKEPASLHATKKPTKHLTKTSFQVEQSNIQPGAFYTLIKRKTFGDKQILFYTFHRKI